MEQSGRVFEVEVEYEGRPHRASYFIESGSIHASVDGSMLTVPLGPRPAADTVKTVLSGYLLQRSRKLGNLNSWSRIWSD